MTLRLVSKFTLQIVFLKFRLSQTSPSRGDPADDSSKGMLAQDANWERFHNGPDYLWQSKEEWPTKQIGSRWGVSNQGYGLRVGWPKFCSCGIVSSE